MEEISLYVRDIEDISLELRHIKDISIYFKDIKETYLDLTQKISLYISKT